MKTWDDISQPVLDSLGFSSREHQRILGQTIVDTLNTTGSLVAEASTGTGKSLALLIPLFDKITEDPDYRAVVSCPVKTLQQQYLSDVNNLLNVNKYSHVITADLKGRDNYLCQHSLAESKGKLDDFTYEKINEMLPRLECGERYEIEDFLNYRLSDKEWAMVSGDSKRCSERKCKPEVCYGALALAKARSANLIITNSAMLRVDCDKRTDGMWEDGYLGPLNCVAVDEAHLMEESFIDGFSLEMSEWEIADSIRKITKGLAVTPLNPAAWKEQSNDFKMFVECVKEFYKEKEHNNRGECVVKQEFISEDSDKSLIGKLLNYEDKLHVIDDTLVMLGVIEKEFYTALDDETVPKGDMRKAITAMHDLATLLTNMSKAFVSERGTFINYIVPYNLVFQFYPALMSKETRGKFVVTPLDISERAKVLWEGCSSILMSATLKDTEDQSFKYVKSSLGYPTDSKELCLPSVFDLYNQQVFYTTSGKYAPADIRGAQFSLEELREVIMQARGRSLVLFTSIKELEAARDHFFRNPLPYSMLFQTPESSKDQLSEEFRLDESSVLFASKSFFQGVSFSGATLSQVVLVKFPFVSYNDLNKNRESWWKGRGFSNWYNSQSMFTFLQAVGRGVRSETDKVMISILDSRVLNTRSRVHQLVNKAVISTGCGATSDINYIGKFLNS